MRLFTITRNEINDCVEATASYVSTLRGANNDVHALVQTLRDVQRTMEVDDSVNAITLRVTGEQHVVLFYVGY